MSTERKSIEKKIRKKSSLGLIPSRVRDYGYGSIVVSEFPTNIAKQETKHHSCNLTGEPRETANQFIDSGIFVGWRRKWRKFTMISPRHPLTKYYAPSLCRQKDEEDRHLILHSYIIYPLSMFSFYVNVLMFFGLLMHMIVTPIVIMAFRTDRFGIWSVMLPALVLYTVLIVLSFTTGYYDLEKNEVILKPSAIAVHYIQTYFIFDLLTILPQVLQGFSMLIYETILNVEDSLMVKIAAPILTICTYPRYLWCLRVLGELRIYSGMNTYTYLVIKLILNTALIIVISVYILYTIMREIPGYKYTSYLLHFKRTISMLFLVGYGHTVYRQTNYRLLPVLFTLIGFLLDLLLMVQGMEILHTFFSVENKQHSVYSSTEAYMRYRALPVELRKRIYLFLDFKYQGYFYKDSAIRKATSPALRKEIHLQIVTESIQKVELFEKCPKLVLNKIRATLVFEIFLPGDVIIKAGTRGHCMFFILSGTVVVTSPENKPLSYLRDGAHFGEIALVINVSRVANVIAVTPCELYKLDRRHFGDVMKHHPQLLTEIKKMAIDRIAKTAGSINDTSLSNKAFSRIPRTISEDVQF